LRRDIERVRDLLDASSRLRRDHVPGAGSRNGTRGRTSEAGSPTRGYFPRKKWIRAGRLDRLEKHDRESTRIGRELARMGAW
jgi:hypothetical protein